MSATLVYKTGVITGATELYNELIPLLTSAFSSSEPRGYGWHQFYTLNTFSIISSSGSNGYERLFVSLNVSFDDTYIERTIPLVADISGGSWNPVGDSNNRIIVGTNTIEYFLIGNKDFFYLVLKDGVDYRHYYTGLINRIGSHDNGSLYGLSAPSPSTTTTPTTEFTIGTNTTVYLRIGTDDGFGGVDGNSNIFTAGQILTVVDQSFGTLTSGNIGTVQVVSSLSDRVVLNYLDGDDTFQSFSVIGIDPLPIFINRNNTIKFDVFDTHYSSDISTPTFSVIDEMNAGVSESIQDPTARNVYVGYAIRLANNNELRGTLYGMIDVPTGAPLALDVYQTYDGTLKYINFPDGSAFIGFGSVR